LALPSAAAAQSGLLILSKSAAFFRYSVEGSGEFSPRTAPDFQRHGTASSVAVVLLQGSECKRRGQSVNPMKQRWVFFCLGEKTFIEIQVAQKSLNLYYRKMFLCHPSTRKRDKDHEIRSQPPSLNRKFIPQITAKLQMSFLAEA
jgi:hypothetical protein